MWKLVIIISILVSPNFCLCQIDNYYKVESEKILQNYFPTATIQKITCDGYLLTSECHSSSSSYVQCENYRDTVELDSNTGCPYKIFTTQYVLYSKELNYSFQLYIYWNKDPVETNFSKAIPNCIKLNTTCNYISRDSAMRIAIKYSNKFNKKTIDATDFIKSRTDKQFYWAFTIYAKTEDDNKKLFRKIPGSRILINSVTGKVVNEKKFKEDW